MRKWSMMFWWRTRMLEKSAPEFMHEAQCDWPYCHVSGTVSFKCQAPAPPRLHSTTKRSSSSTFEPFVFIRFLYHSQCHCKSHPLIVPRNNTNLNSAAIFWVKSHGTCTTAITSRGSGATRQPPVSVSLPRKSGNRRRTARGALPSWEVKRRLH